MFTQEEFKKIEKDLLEQSQWFKLTSPKPDFTIKDTKATTNKTDLESITITRPVILSDSERNVCYFSVSSSEISEITECAETVIKKNFYWTDALLAAAMYCLATLVTNCTSGTIPTITNMLLTAGTCIFGLCYFFTVKGNVNNHSELASKVIKFSSRVKGKKE